MNDATAKTRFIIGDVRDKQLVWNDYDTDAEVHKDEIFRGIRQALVHFKVRVTVQY